MTTPNKVKAKPIVALLTNPSKVLWRCLNEACPKHFVDVEPTGVLGFPACQTCFEGLYYRFAGVE